MNILKDWTKFNDAIDWDNFDEEETRYKKEVVFDKLKRKEKNLFLDSLIGEIAEFYSSDYGIVKKIGPVKISGWELDLPEGGDNPGYDIFINGKEGYFDDGIERNVDYFQLDTNRPIRVLKTK